jgi:hypothetical protein
VADAAIVHMVPKTTVPTDGSGRMMDSSTKVFLPVTSLMVAVSDFFKVNRLNRAYRIPLLSASLPMETLTYM